LSKKITTTNILLAKSIVRTFCEKGRTGFWSLFFFCNKKEQDLFALFFRGGLGRVKYAPRTPSIIRAHENILQSKRFLGKRRSPLSVVLFAIANC